VTTTLVQFKVPGVYQVVTGRKASSTQPVHGPDVDPFVRGLVVFDPSLNVVGVMEKVVVALGVVLDVAGDVGVMAGVLVRWELEEGGVRVVEEMEAVPEGVVVPLVAVVVGDDVLKPFLSKRRPSERAAQRAAHSRVRLLMLRTACTKTRETSD
jgi:hypothetical protein